MKKLVILTSVLALAACSGGHSGGGAAAPINPDDNGFPTINAPENSGDNGAVNAGSETTDNENGGENNTENTDSNDSSESTNGDNNASDNDNGASGAAGATDENNSGMTGDNNENAGTENGGETNADNTNSENTGSNDSDENTNTPDEGNNSEPSNENVDSGNSSENTETPEITEPDVPETPIIPTPEPTVIMNLTKTVSMESEQADYLKGQLGDDYDTYMAELRAGTATVPSVASLRAGGARTSATGGCKTDAACHKQMIDNMHNVLDMYLGKSADTITALEGAAQKALERALLIAGYIKSDLDTIKSAWEKKKIEIEDKIDDVLYTPGKGKIYSDLGDTDFAAIITSGEINLMNIQVNDDDEISGLVIHNNEDGYDIGSSFTSGMKRKGDTNEFVFGENGELSGSMEMISYAQDLGLKYSDFGVLVATEGTTATDEDGTYSVAGFQAPFAGGYTTKMVDKSDMQANMEFKGLAKGTVQAADEELKEIEDKSATLTFDKKSGNETLAAKFDNWYNVELIKKSDDDIETNFDDTGKDIADKFRFTEKDPSKYDKNPEMRAFETAYYGDNGVASEAVALVQYQNVSKDHENEQPEDGTYLNMYLGFGGTVQK